MGHVEPSHLVELALGHANTDEDADALRHIASCRRCREELRLMIRVVTAARDAQVSDLLPAVPPERVWQRIIQELSLDANRLPHPRRRPVHRSAPEPVRGVRLRRTAGAGRREGLLALALAAGIVLVRWLRIRTGRGPVRQPDRRRRSPWWHRG